MAAAAAAAAVAPLSAAALAQLPRGGPPGDCWGFASSLPSLQQLQAAAAARRRGRADAGAGSSAAGAGDEHSADDGGSYVAQLAASQPFASNACVDAMAAAYGLRDLADGLAGSLLCAQPPQGGGGSSGAHAALASLRSSIDSAWSQEAVCRGVAYAKAGRCAWGHVWFLHACMHMPPGWCLVSCSSCEACVCRLCWPTTAAPLRTPGITYTHVVWCVSDRRLRAGAGLL